ncbi:PfkB family carbohydrate kinase [Marinicauda salina]|nr:PfkB family carbohydrate kinase [Marinicauda salina]
MTTRPAVPQTVTLLTSQVAGSRVGGGVSAHVLTMGGLTPEFVPTVVIGRHPGLGVPGGGPTPDAVFAGALDSLGANGNRARAAAILAGYFATPVQVAAAAAFIDAARAENPDVLVVVDPICGDGPADADAAHLYVDPAIAAAIRDALVPRANLITPNLFELSWLSGTPLASSEDAIDAARSLGRPALVTSAPAGEGRIGVLAVTADEAWLAETTRFETVPRGTGDLLAALALFERLGGATLSETAQRAAARSAAVIRRTAELDASDLVLDAGLFALDVDPIAARRPGAKGPAWVIGLDGCPGGWLGVLIDLNGIEPPRARLFPDFASALEAEERPHVVAVDMPIGFEDAPSGSGGRACEREARAILGPRRSSVFASPLRPALEAESYDAALAANRAAGGPGLSRQTWNIMARMREIDRAMTPMREGCVHEVHPEVTFATLAGAPMIHAKKTAEGRAERLAVLIDHGLPRDLLDPHPFKRREAAPDDLLDAAACAVSARRIAEGGALCLPADPPRDARGLRMAIFA